MCVTGWDEVVAAREMRGLNLSHLPLAPDAIELAAYRGSLARKTAVAAFDEGLTCKYACDYSLSCPLSHCKRERYVRHNSSGLLALLRWMLHSH